MKIGIFGGTFNPPHIGHLIAAESVCETLKLDKVFFIPAFISPLKNDGENVSSDLRLEMTRLAIAGNSKFECLDIEIIKTTISYTINTLSELKKKYFNDDLFLIIGMDNYRSFHLWNEPQKITELAELIVLNRPNNSNEINSNIEIQKIQFIKVPNIEISSSGIREKIKKGESIRYLVTDEIKKYIVQKNLYK